MARILDFSQEESCSSRRRRVEMFGVLSSHRAIVDPETPVASHSSFCERPMAFSLFFMAARNFTMLSEYNSKWSDFMFLPIAFTQKYMLINMFICVSILAQTQSVVNRR